jgi:SpoVK/Ycf46/Vps4 family AAA+-type ATPase
MKNKYQSEILDYALKLDILTKSEGKFIENTKSIIEEQDESTTKLLFSRISIQINKENCTAEIKQISKLLMDSIYKYYGYNRVCEICKFEYAQEDTRTLTELQYELNRLIGLNNVKQQIRDLIAYQQIQELRKKQGLNNVNRTLHLAFLGNPGTGKTTVARIVGRIYKQIGLLTKGHFIEVSRTDLIAGYQGQTSLKVKKVIEKAKGGVLFIDEAYSITENEHSDSYGRECLTELTKALEDYRDDLVVIVAGYNDPMNVFFKSNPGLKSRFNNFIQFDDYNADELENILIKMCEKDNYIIKNETKHLIKKHLIKKTSSKDENFANGRLVRNLYDNLIMNQAKRIIKVKKLTRETLMEISNDDFMKS